MNLYDALTKYCSTDAYPFHMPGHKRRAAFLCDPASIDLTEIDGFDNLHHAEGLLKEAQERAAALYGSSETHFLVNGSTAGILSAIGACASPGRCLLMARASHRSAFHAVALNQLRTAYLYGSSLAPAGERNTEAHARTGSGSDRRKDGNLSGVLNGPVDPDQVEEALSRQEDVCAVFVTSPTYDGVVSHIAQIARIAHRHGVPLIVDEAHGAHFGMHKIFPESSVKLGADLVIHSLHKTLPALTQTALLHVNGSLVDREKLRFLLSVYQTSSPSYVLMASIDQCIRLLREEGKGLFDAYAQRLQRFYESTRLSGLSFLRTDDPSRILVRVPAGYGTSPGPAEDSARAFALSARSAQAGSTMAQTGALLLSRRLRERFHLEPEMTAWSYVLLLSSVCDDDEGFGRLSGALMTLDQEYLDLTRSARSAGAIAAAKDAGTEADAAKDAGIEAAVPKAKAYCTIARALGSRTQSVPFSGSGGYVSAEFLMQYPPGVPLLLPGERISGQIIRSVTELQSRGYSLTGPADETLKQIRVILE